MSAFGQSKDLVVTYLPASLNWMNNSANDILQDSEGYLWVAQWSGLARFDGYTVRQYQQQIGRPHGLKSNKITCLFEDSRQQLWVGSTYSGFYRYDRDKDEFRQFVDDPGDMNSLSNNNIWAITEDRYGMLWIGTENGLNRFDPATGNFLHFHRIDGDTRSLSNNFVYSLAETRNGDLWVGTEKGLNRLIRNPDGSPQYFAHYPLSPPGTPENDFLSRNFIKALSANSTSGDTLLVGTRSGLIRVAYSGNRPAAYTYRGYGNRPGMAGDGATETAFVNDIFGDGDNGDAWVATYDGLYRLNGRAETMTRVTSANSPELLEGNLIKSLYLDRSGMLWLGGGMGISKVNLNANPFENINFRSEANIIRRIIPASNNSGLWIGTDGGGIVYLPTVNGRVDTTGMTYHRIETTTFGDLANYVTDLIIDNNGYLWVATEGAGVFRINEADIPPRNSNLTTFTQYTKAEALSDDYVMSLLQAEDGNIWLGYWDRGVSVFTPETQIFHHFTHTDDLSTPLQEYPVVNLYEVPGEGNSGTWVGTRGGGVYHLDYRAELASLHLLGQYRYEDGSAAGLSSNSINTFNRGGEGSLWIGTEYGLDLLNTNTGTLSHFLNAEGTDERVVQSVLYDERGKIWVSTRRGVAEVDPTRAGGAGIKSYSAYDGLREQYFNDGAAYALPGGQLLFGGMSGLKVFSPDEIQPDRIAPQVVINDFRLFNRSVPVDESFRGRTILEKVISETETVELRYSDNVFSIGFVGLQFTEPQQNRYAYRLLGFNEEWMYAAVNERVAHYTNLPHGTYTFEVKAANGDGIWSKPATLSIEVAPPFWLTNWAMVAYALLLLALIYGARTLIRMKARYEYDLKLEKMEKDKIREVTQLKLHFFTNISHELRTPLTLIIGPLEQLIREESIDKLRHKLFGRMHHNANRLLLMINQLLDIRKGEAGLMTLTVVKSDIVKFTREITLSFQPLCEQRGIALNFSSEEERIELWFDRTEMEKVFYNLLSNALKFTGDGGNIDLHINQREGNRVGINVSDNGIGMREEELASVFDRFYQVRQSGESEFAAGSGIGLSLVKNILEKHHGSIEASSEIGNGSAFLVRLLRGRDHFATEEIQEDYRGSEHIGHYVDQPAAVAVDELADGSKPMLLIVEDNADIRDYLRENLSADYEITEATNGLEGYNASLECAPDLVIADIAMPVMDGLTLCSKIKSNLNTSHVPVILLTARTSLIFKINSYENGADDYIIKPFNMQLLKARVSNLLATRARVKRYLAQPFDFDPADVVLNPLDEEFLQQLKAAVEEHIDDSTFSVESLAQALNLSRMQLYRKLKGLTGETPNKIIRSIRLKRAVQLLKREQYNISDVTYMVGYNDLKSFRQQFKKEYGASPSAYLKMEKEQEIE